MLCLHIKQEQYIHSTNLAVCFNDFLHTHVLIVLYNFLTSATDHGRDMKGTQKFAARSTNRVNFSCVA